MATPRRRDHIPPSQSLLLGAPRQAGRPPNWPAAGPDQAPGPHRTADPRAHRNPRGSGVRADRADPRGSRVPAGRADPRGRLPAGRLVRPGARAAAALAGLVLAVAGAFIVFRAVAGSARTLTGGATMVPSSVGTAPPRTTANTAAALKPSAPVRIIIPSLRVDAPVMRLGRAADGSIQVPPLANHNLAGWYDHSVTPGQDGTSVILGHVDSFTGTSVFYSIKNLTRGELVEVVRADGRTATFSVDGVQVVAKATFPAAQIYGNTRYPELRLITCGGPFDTATRQYLDNIVVYTHLVG